MAGIVNPKKIIRYLWIAVSLFTLVVAIIDGVDVAESVAIFMFILTVPVGVLGAELMNVLQGYGLLPASGVSLLVFVWLVYFCAGYIQWVWFVGGIIIWFAKKAQSWRDTG